MTSTLITTPRMTWSIAYLIAKVARIREINIPAIGATIKPNKALCVRLATTAEANAPANN